MFVSNVYHWGYGILAHHDPDYVRNCLNYNQLCRITDSNIPLSDLQARFVKYVSACRTVQFKKLQKQHRQLRDWDERHYDFPNPFGFVRIDGVLKLVCRCEDDSCENFSKCMPNPIVRELNETIAESENTENDIKYEWLDTIAEEQIFAEPEGDFEETEDAIPEEYTVAPTVIAGEFVELADSTAIITANIDSHILVNAGAGTGKTHTVIERLAYIIDSSEVDLGQVLVLCYTNAARDVIIQRLTEKGMGEAARQLVICTLDSLAWQNLSSNFENDSEISSLFALGYNGCIKKFQS
jgi:hypothetical protein